MKSVIKIGRDNTNDVIINEPGVSRNHAIITDLGNGIYEVKDLGSSNGTFVNGHRISRQTMGLGDVLKVASCTVEWLAAFQNTAVKKTDSLIMEKEFSRIRKTIMVGSAEDNDIIMDNSFVSAHHAKISVLKNGNYYLQDMGSSNGSFVNGAKVMAKNFSKTDVVKIANTDLPNDWFLHDKLKTGFLKDYKRLVWISVSIILLSTAGILSYVNRCSWFGWDCYLSAKQLYVKNQNALVKIEHEYYYTIQFREIKYYVGKNRDFNSQTEANPDKTNLLPYGRISGNGCFIKSDGTILTSPLLINPWIYADAEKEKMMQEIIASRTIKGLSNSNKAEILICGETAVIRWLPNGLIINQQNYVEASSIKECILSDSASAIITSVKKGLPANAVPAVFFYSDNLNKAMHNSEEKYYSYFNDPQSGEMLKDTFYVGKDSFDINKISVMPVADSIPAMTEGNAVFNSRGELIGIIRQQKVSLLHNYIKQIKN